MGVGLLTLAAPASAASAEWRVGGRILAPTAGVRYFGDLHSVPDAARCAWLTAGPASQGALGYVAEVPASVRGGTYTLATPRLSGLTVATLDIVY